MLRNHPNSMNEPTTGGATEHQRKRARNDTDGNDNSQAESLFGGSDDNSESHDGYDNEAGGGPAAPTANTPHQGRTISTNDTIHEIAIPTSIRGGRLDPVKEVLESLPTELQQKVTSLLGDVLDLFATIKQKEETRARFTKSAKDPTTGETLKDGAGNERTFVPNSLRGKCPIKASKQSNDDPRMMTLLDEGEKLYSAWQTTAAKHCEKIAQLELTIRQEEIRTKIHDLAYMIASSYVCINEILEGGLPNGTTLTTDELADTAVYEALAKLEIEHIGALWMQSGRQLADDYAKYRAYDVEATNTKMMEMVDSEEAPDEVTLYVTPVKAIITRLIPTLTTKLWENELAKEKERKISAALKKLLTTKAMATATREVDSAMDDVDGDGPDDELMKKVRAATKTAVGKEVQVLKRAMRKKYSGDAKNQALQPEKNGRENKADSTSSRSASNTKSRANAQGGKSKSKKKNPKSSSNGKGEEKTKEKTKVKFKPGTKKGKKTPTHQTAGKSATGRGGQGGRGGRGGRGGANNAGRGKGAGKR